MERYHIYKLGLAILFYAVYFARQTVVNGLKIDDVTSTTNTTDYRERRDSGDDNGFFYQGADGTPGVDFPTLSYVPRTKFTCRNMEAGYYADLETDCQVFHICDEGRKLSFLCPNGTTFQQSELICDWWFKVNCSNSPSLYEESAEILQRANAKRKDNNRRLSHHGTKQGVFSSNEDYNNGQETFGGTPAHFVTPSYRSSLKTIDNRISSTTEGSVRKNYNGRGDRTLDSFGNGVKERDYDKNNQFSTGNGQNYFDVKLKERDQSAFSTSSQQKTGSEQFAFTKNLHSATTNGFTSGNFGRNQNQDSFGRTSQQNIRGRDQNSFDSTLQSNSGRIANSEITTHGGGQASFNRNSQRTTSGYNQGTFANNEKHATFGTGRYQVDNSRVFGANSQTHTGRQNQNVFENSNVQENGASFGTQIHGNTKTEEQAAFVTENLFDGQKTFGARLQGGISKAAQTRFAVNLEDKTDRTEQVTYGGDTQEHTRASRIRANTTPPPLDRSAHGTRGRGQNIFSRGQVTFSTDIQTIDKNSQKADGRDQNVYTRGQIPFDSSTQQTVGNRASQLLSDRSTQKSSEYDENRFSVNTKQTFRSGGDSEHIAIGKNRQDNNSGDGSAFGRGQHISGTNSQQTTGSNASDKSSQKASEYNRNYEFSKFSSTSQSTFDRNPSEISPDTKSVTTNGRDRNVFGSDLRGNSAQFGSGLGGTSSNIGGEIDKIKFSISSQGKSDVFDTNKQQSRGGYQQNTFNAISQTPLPDRGQPIAIRGSHTTFGGIGQNRFDLNLQGKSEKFETTTSSYKLKSIDTTQGALNFASHVEQEDDGGKIPVLVVSAETQEPQESASFVKSGRNNLLDNNRQVTTNPYPNHREIYTDIKDPRHFYQQPQSKLPEKPFYGSSVSPQVLSTVPVSSHESSRSTTEVSRRKENIGSTFGSRADISTTEQPIDTDAITYRRNLYGSDIATTFAPFKQLSTGKSSVTTNRFSFVSNETPKTKPSIELDSGTPPIDTSTIEISNFDQSTIPSVAKLATIGSNKVDVTTYDRSFVNGVDLHRNTISSTAFPDISDIVGKSTVYTDSQKNKYYNGKFSSSSKSNIYTTEAPYANSPIIKLNILSPTASPQFETSSRSGKSFNTDSPKIQVIRLDGSRTKDFGTRTFDVTGNGGDRRRISVSFGLGDKGRLLTSDQTVPPGFIKVKTNGISAGGNGNSFRVVTGVNITPSFTVNKFRDKTAGEGIATRTSAANNYDKNFVSSSLSTAAVPLSASTVDINTNDHPSTFPVGDDNIGVTSAQGKINVDIIRATSATPTEKETVKFTINDEIFTTPTSDSTQTINININNENHSTPSSVFSATRQGEFGNTATTVNPVRDDVLYTSTSSILQPKPFSPLPNTVPGLESTEKSLFEQTGTPQVPPYTISSASPFSTTTKSASVFESKTVTPTLPTPYTTESTSSYSYNPTDENINNVINTLMGVVKQRFGSNDIGFGTPRPGLVVPPSAGPQTLHTLAIYFANALDNLTSSSPREEPEETDEETGTNSPIIHIDNEELIKSLLTQMTRNNYETLFKEKDATTTEFPVSLRNSGDDDENDLIREDTKHPTEGPGVRQLARVFTEALSAYLEDPDTFKKVLHDVRPTEPPLLAYGNETTEAEEDEVLNYSDSDLKSDHPHLPVRPTGIPVNPTWGYLLAYNKSSPVSNNLESQSSTGSENENLLSADSQSFVSQLNKVTQAFKTASTLDGAKVTTEAPQATGFTNGDTDKGLPDNHWTTSSDVTKLWQTTLSINPAILNENFDSSQSGQGFTSPDVDTRFSTATSEDGHEPARVSEIQYELRSLPKIELNSTQVHGILIDFMNATQTEGSEKLQRVLHKLNISQDEFLNKMKEIEGNPLTRRLILLLISECNTERNKDLETRSSVFDLAQSKLNSGNTERPPVTPLQLSTLDGDGSITESNSFKHVVHPSLDDDDEDTRALELLNSLYVIASKFGK